MCSDAPDTTAMNTAATSQAKMSEEQLAWAKQIYADTAPDRANATKRANAISDAQLSAMEKQSALTDDYAKYQRETFRPLEAGIVADAQGYDTEARREAEAGRGLADVEYSLAAQKGAMTRDLERKGVNPASGAALALANATSMGSAAMKASAANSARKQVETMGLARRLDAANLGRNLASNQATSAGIALNQGNASSNNAQAAGNVSGQGAQLLNSGYNGAQMGLANATNTYGRIAGSEAGADASNAQTMGGLGSVVGGVMIAI